MLPVMAKKKKLGRPPLPKDQRHPEIVTFRMSKAERAMITAAAKDAGEKLSEWIRATLIGVAEAVLIEKRRGGESNPSDSGSVAP